LVFRNTVEIVKINLPSSKICKHSFCKHWTSTDCWLDDFVKTSGMMHFWINAFKHFKESLMQNSNCVQVSDF